MLITYFPENASGKSVLPSCIWVFGKSKLSTLFIENLWHVVVFQRGIRQIAVCAKKGSYIFYNIFRYVYCVLVVGTSQSICVYLNDDDDDYNK